MNKNIPKYLISFILAGVLVYFAFRGVDWTAFWQGLGQTRWGWVALFVVFSLLALVLREERWRALIEPFDPEVKRLDVWDSVTSGTL